MTTAEIVTLARKWLQEAGYSLPAGNVVAADAKASVKLLLRQAGIRDATSDTELTSADAATLALSLLQNAGYSLTASATLVLADIRARVRTILTQAGVQSLTTGAVTATNVSSTGQTLIKGLVQPESELTLLADADVTDQAARWLADEGNTNWLSTELTDLLTQAKARFKANRPDIQMNNVGTSAFASIHLDALTHLVCHYAFLNDGDDNFNASLAESHLGRYQVLAQTLPSTWLDTSLTSVAEDVLESFQTRHPELMDGTDIPAEYEQAMAHLFAYHVLLRGPEKAQALAGSHYQAYEASLSGAGNIQDSTIDSIIDAAVHDLINDAPQLFADSGALTTKSVTNLDQFFESALVARSAYRALLFVAPDRAAAFLGEYKESIAKWPVASWTSLGLTSFADAAKKQFLSEAPQMGTAVPDSYEMPIASLTASLALQSVPSESARSAAGVFQSQYMEALKMVAPTFTDSGLDSLTDMAGQQLVVDAPRFFSSDGAIAYTALTDIPALLENALVQYTAHLACAGRPGAAQNFLNSYTQAQARWPKRILDATGFTSLAEEAVASLGRKRPDLRLSEDGATLKTEALFTVADVPEAFLHPLAARVCYDALLSASSDAGRQMIANFDAMWQKGA